MSKWVTGRKPTADDANAEEDVITSEVGLCYYGCVSSLWHWMPNPPVVKKPPKQRTLEDVVGEYLDTSNPQPKTELLQEMRDIIKENK